MAKPTTRERNLGLPDAPRFRGGPNVNFRPATRFKGNNHPTVKSVALMRYLCRLVTPPGGLILDPFTGSGSTGVAALEEGFRFLGLEREEAFVEIARHRLEHAQLASTPKRRAA